MWPVEATWEQFDQAIKLMSNVRQESATLYVRFRHGAEAWTKGEEPLSSTRHMALSSGIDGDGRTDGSGDHVSDRRVEVDVRFRRTDRDDQAVPGRKVVAFQSGACAPPTLRWVDGDKAAICQLGGGSAPDILVQRTAMPLPVAKNPMQVLGINRDTIIFQLRCRVDPSDKVRCRRIERALHIEAQPMRRVVELRRGPCHRPA